MKYTRIYIKSEANLPEKNGEYFVYVKGSIGMDVYTWSKESNPEYWIETFDWYLLPDTEPSYPEEFVEWCIENIDEEEREEVDYYYSYFNRGNVIGFDTIKDVYDFWLNEIKDK